MNNTKAFSSVLARIRKEQGFSSAHKFFKSVGGSKTLGLSFMSYWDMERGKKLPKSWRLKAIIGALGIEAHAPGAQELVRAYFRALSGSDELLEILSAPAKSAPDLPSMELAEAAAHRALSQRAVNLTMEQWELRARDIVNNISLNYLANTTGWVTVREISEATKFKPAAVKKALKALAAGGLAEVSGDKARTPFAEKIIKALPMTPETAKVRGKLADHWRKWLAASPRVEIKRMSVRMTKANLDIYRQHLEKAVNLSSIYGNAGENRQDSAVYFVDARIYQLYPRN